MNLSAWMSAFGLLVLAYVLGFTSAIALMTPTPVVPF